MLQQTGEYFRPPGLYDPYPRHRNPTFYAAPSPNPAQFKVPGKTPYRSKPLPSQAGMKPSGQYNSGARAIARRYRKKSTCDPRRGFVGVETKYVDVAPTSYECSTTGTITHLNVIPTGTTVNSRLGKSCKVKSVRVTGYVQNQASAVFNHCEIIYVWDLQPNKALPAITDIWDQVTTTYQRRMENAERFKILKSFTVDLNGAPGQPYSAESFNHSISVPAGYVTLWTTGDTTGVIGDLIEGALLMVTRSQNATGTNIAANFIASHRVFFSDKQA